MACLPQQLLNFGNQYPFIAWAVPYVSIAHYTFVVNQDIRGYTADFIGPSHTVFGIQQHGYSVLPVTDELSRRSFAIKTDSQHR